ncbi:hypothetical protein K7957_05165 [Sphingomonas yunnanensis]|uniref:hypothetical protein n=1 Tax=Sphingomonas yunnanensis TaxID=310400 RepID=UPI001CA74A1D|nr:hypothetical protein [Sphingomonas yunnanensis]MBY9062319.1 hypothetical protein [Sphingomonas yunnanensis]
MRCSEEFEFQELALKLVEAGVPAEATLSDLIAGVHRSRDGAVTISIDLEDGEAIDRLSPDAIVDAYRDMRGLCVSDRDVEDTIRYARNGELGLARAMVGRVFEGAELAAAERALA